VIEQKLKTADGREAFNAKQTPPAARKSDRMRMGDPGISIPPPVRGRPKHRLLE
jgi:hypothetical protein